MRLLITVAILISSVMNLLGSMTLLKQEMFLGSGAVSADHPGTNFDRVIGALTKRAGGPSDWSAEIPDCPSPNYGLFNPGAGSNRMAVCGWFFFKRPGVPVTSEVPILAIRCGGSSTFRWGFRNGTVFANQIYTEGWDIPIPPTNQWIFLMIAARHIGDWNWDSRYYYKTVGGMLTCVGGTTNFAAWYTGASGYLFGQDAIMDQYGSFRIGSASLYSFENDDFSDISYPISLPEPTNTARTWYVNPATGSDGNDGTTAKSAWQTVDALNSASLGCGFFPANSRNGDTLIVDTSQGDLDLGTNQLQFATPGLNARTAEGQSWWTVKAHVTIQTNAWIKTPSFTNTYQATVGPGQPNIVLWEDNKWMNHPTGAVWSIVANLVDGVPGSFWTDGTTLFCHPFGDTDPRFDGKVYDRSIHRVGAGPAVKLMASNITLKDLRCGKTCLAQSTDNDPLGGSVLSTMGVVNGTNLIEHCYLHYGGKHVLSLVAEAVNSEFTMRDVQCEQGTAYAGQSPFVSYMAGANSTNNVHRFIRCSSFATTGLVGSAAGTSSQPAFLCHNNGFGIQWSSFCFTDCTFPRANISVGIAPNVSLAGCLIGSASFYSPNATVSRCKFDTASWSMMYTTDPTLTIQNCIFAPTTRLSADLWPGGRVRGVVTVEGCTFDLSNIPSSDAPARGIIN